MKLGDCGAAQELEVGFQRLNIHNTAEVTRAWSKKDKWHETNMRKQMFAFAVGFVSSLGKEVERKGQRHIVSTKHR